MQATVKQGKVVIDSVDLCQDDPTCKTFLISCKSKYAEALQYGFHDGELEIILSANERTLHTDPDADEFTYITIPLEGEWWVAIEGGRYDWHVVLYQPMTHDSLTPLFARRETVQ